MSNYVQTLVLPKAKGAIVSPSTGLSVPMGMRRHAGGGPAFINGLAIGAGFAVAGVLLTRMLNSGGTATAGQRQEWTQLGAGVRARASFRQIAIVGARLRQNARMGATLAKSPGDVVGVSMSCRFETVNASGVKILWPYLLLAQLWQTATPAVQVMAVTDSPTGAFVTRTPTTIDIGLSPAPNQLRIPTDAIVGDFYHIQAFILAKRSDPQGNPQTTGTVQVAGPIPGNSNILIRSSVAPARPGATINTVSVSQRQ